jgi:hypothetical protein
MTILRFQSQDSFIILSFCMLIQYYFDFNSSDNYDVNVLRLQ